MQYWAISDPGCVRQQNQDAWQVEQLDKQTLLAVVCDGMGGAKSGNIASNLALEVFIQEIKQSWSPSMDRSRVDSMFYAAAKLANFAVFDQAAQFEDFAGMGTTLAAVLVRGLEATVVNVGDSRVYAVDSEDITQLTKDHSLVQMMVERGELTQEMARSYPGKNFITRAIGTEPVVDCDLFHHKLERGDCLLLCTDGLCNMMDDQEILFEVVHGVNKPKCCERLLEIAKNRGAPDNVTSVLIQV